MVAKIYSLLIINHCSGISAASKIRLAEFVPEKERVIMDTSHGHKSLTLSFLLGDGTDLPVPTDKDLAQLLLATSDDLMAQGILADVIGNRPPEAGENHMLASALEAIDSSNKSDLQSVRARKVFTANRISDMDPSAVIEHDYLYIACTRSEALWLVVTYSDGAYKLSRLTTVESMMDFFSYRAHWAAHIGLQILDSLKQIMKAESATKRDKARRIANSAASLDQVSGRVRSAFTIPRTSGDGIEG